MLHKDRPVTGTNAQAFVRGLHISARIEDRAPGGLAHVVDDQLAVPPETVLAMTFPEHTELGIIEQSGQGVSRDGGNGIIATQACL